MFLYQPRGRAGEFGKWALSVWTGCDVGCIYCYVPRVLRVERSVFQVVHPRRGLIVGLEKELRAAQKDRYEVGHGRHVFLSFSCDPYPIIEGEAKVTRKVIDLLHYYGHTVKICTKRPSLAARDFSLLGPGDEFGTTLTQLGSWDSERWEPRADQPSARIAALKEAHDRGIKTWVSLEPVIDPMSSLAAVDLTKGFVGYYAVGPVNDRPDCSPGEDVYRTYCAALTELAKRNNLVIRWKREMLPYLAGVK